MNETPLSSCHLGDSKGFRSSVPETKMKTKSIFIISHSIAVPNTGHGGVRTSLLNGHTRYREDPASLPPPGLLLVGKQAEQVCIAEVRPTTSHRGPGYACIQDVQGKAPAAKESEQMSPLCSPEPRAVVR